MALHLPNDFPSRLLMWRRVREYAVPPSMIEAAAARREVGDWAGACAAARIDVDFHLRAVRDRYGCELATRLRADLRGLAPDLLRWHMPRSAPDGRLRPALTVCLARYPRSDAAPLHLVVRTPPAWADAGQRMSLALWEGSGTHVAGQRGHPHPHPYQHPHPHPDRRFRLDLHRHLWDSRRCGELAWRSGAVGDPSAAPGRRPDWTTVDGPPWATGRWAAEAELLLRAEGRPRGAFTVRLGAGRSEVLELVAPDDSHAPTFRPVRGVLPPQEVARLPVLPEVAARALPDWELLRSGLVAAERLHPLVAAVLVSSGPVTAAETAPAPCDPHRVECRGEVHRIALRDGVLTAIDHDPEQLRREDLLVALGGPALPCLRAIDAVHRSPEALPAVRERLTHGDVTGALNVVENLLGPGAILRDGPLRDELESAAARRIDHGLFRSGLAHAGIGSGAVEADGRGSAAGRESARRRARHERRTSPWLERKLNSRARPRTGMAA